MVGLKEKAIAPAKVPGGLAADSRLRVGFNVT
jgi:hypothetical protein